MNEDVKRVEIRNLFVSPGHNYYGHYGKPPGENELIEHGELELHAGRGVVGDRFYDYKPDYKGQVTLFDQAVYEAVRDEVVKGELEPGAFRRNVMVAGVDLNELIGKRFRLQGVELQGTEECKPCFWMDQACADGAHEFLKGRGGLRCKILTDGVLKAGEAEIEVLS